MVVSDPPCYDKSIRKVSRRCLRIDSLRVSTTCVGGIGNHPTSNGEYNWQSKKVHHVSSRRALPSLQFINLSPERHHHHSKRLLKRISEEFDLETADEMTFVVERNNDFQQGSTSSEPQGPQQYYGSGLGDASFVENDDEYEMLLDEGLAREGLYRGMSCIYLFPYYSTCAKIWRQGSYRNLLFLYTVVPLTTLLSFICFALVPTIVFTTQTPSLFPYPPYLPFPVLEVLTATALWSLSYLLRDFLYATAFFIVSSLSSFSSTIIATILSATLQTTSNLLLRQIAIPVLLIPHYSSKHHLEQHYPTWKDDAFRRVWWVALGWAAAEAVVGVKQGYESIALYKDVLVNVDMSTLNTEMESRRERPQAPQKQHEREDVDTTTTTTTTATSKQMDLENQRRRDSTSSPTRRQYPFSIGSSHHHHHMLAEEATPPITDEHQPLLRTLTRLVDDESERLQAENEVEKDLDQLIALKNREELEEVYGIPFIVNFFFFFFFFLFVFFLHRIYLTEHSFLPFF